MKQRPLVSQRSLQQMLQSAAAAWNEQDFGQAIDILQRAQRMDPSNVGILLELGRVCGTRYDYGAAHDWFEKAIALAPHKSDALVMAALHSRAFGRFDMACDYLERASQEANASADTLVKLAEVYERLRRVQDASDAIDRALKLDANCVLALLVRGRLDRLAGKLDQAQTVLRSFLDRSDPNTWSTRVRGWYELGAVLDRLGKYDEAMSAFLEAKALLLPAAKPYLAAIGGVYARVEDVARNVTEEMLKRWRDEAPALAPPAYRVALLCGHPRSGTTLLEQVLDAHSKVVSAEETDVFRDEAYLPLRRGKPPQTSMLSTLSSATTASLRKSRRDYFDFIQKKLGQKIDGRLLIDKNPSLTTLVPAFARIFPEAKFLVALRDPRDVCLSCFMQPLPLNPVSAAFLSLEGTVREYASTMGLWQALSPRLGASVAMQVRYEDVVADLDSSAKRVLEFLGLPWEPDVLRFDEHAREKLVRSPTYADVVKPVFKGAVGRWRHYEKHLEPYLEKLEGFVKAFRYE